MGLQEMIDNGRRHPRKLLADNDPAERPRLADLAGVGGELRSLARLAFGTTEHSKLEPMVTGETVTTAVTTGETVTGDGC